MRGMQEGRGVKPYYEHGGVTLYHGDCREILPALDLAGIGTLVTDPPYGIDYESGSARIEGNARSIVNDANTNVRDAVLQAWGERPALVFGSWKVARPAGTRGVLVWDKGGALGMGDLSLPWKFDHEEIYVIGRGFTGRRNCGSVIRCPPVQSVGRAHPNEKPVRLLLALVAKCAPGGIVDPCAGVGPSLQAAKNLGRRAIGIEIEERYCEIAAKRLAQEVLPLGGVA